MVKLVLVQLLLLATAMTVLPVASVKVVPEQLALLGAFPPLVLLYAQHVQWVRSALRGRLPLACA